MLEVTLRSLDGVWESSSGAARPRRGRCRVPCGRCVGQHPSGWRRSCWSASGWRSRALKGRRAGLRSAPIRSPRPRRPRLNDTSSTPSTSPPTATSTPLDDDIDDEREPADRAGRTVARRRRCVVPRARLVRHRRGRVRRRPDLRPDDGSARWDRVRRGRSARRRRHGAARRDRPRRLVSVGRRRRGAMDDTRRRAARRAPRGEGGRLHRRRRRDVRGAVAAPIDGDRVSRRLVRHRGRFVRAQRAGRRQCVASRVRSSLRQGDVAVRDHGARRDDSHRQRRAGRRDPRR